MRVEWSVLTETSRNSLEELKIVQENLRAVWEDWRKERKECRCSQEGEIAPVQSLIK